MPRDLERLTFFGAAEQLTGIVQQLADIDPLHERNSSHRGAGAVLRLSRPQAEPAGGRLREETQAYRDWEQSTYKMWEKFICKICIRQEAKLTLTAC